MRIALASLNQKWENKEANIQRCKVLTKNAKSKNADLVIFPEMTLTGYTMNIGYSSEQIDSSKSVKFFSDIALENNIKVIAGVVLKSSNKPKNALLTFSNNGITLAKYYKIHLFSPSNEDNLFQPGNKLVKLKMNDFNFGFSICYDLRFPELYSALATDCDVIVNIANWPKKRIMHWKTLLKARAIENQVYLIGVNRVGLDGNGIEYDSSSGIVNPDGDFIEPVYTETELDIYEIDKKKILDCRKNLFSRSDRKNLFYRSII